MKHMLSTAAGVAAGIVVGAGIVAGIAVAVVAEGNRRMWETFTGRASKAGK